MTTNPETTMPANQTEWHRQRVARDQTLSRLPPHSPEAEQGILGCCLLDPAEVIGRCVEAGIEPEAFYDLRHQLIFSDLLKMFENATPIDMVTVSDHMRGHQRLDSIGGPAYLSSLQDATPSAANASYYIEILMEKRRLRNVLRTCSEAVAKIHDAGDNNAQSIIDEAETAILRLSQDQAKTKLRTIKELARAAVDRIQEYQQKQAPTIGLPTGFVDLDNITGGLKPGNVYVVAARPSAGKTSLGMNIATKIALDGENVGIFSLEMTADELAMRLLCSEGKLNGRSLEAGNVSVGDMRRLNNALVAVGKSGIHIDDTAGLTINQIRARGRRMWSQLNCRCFVIDYLQLIRGTSKRSADNRQNEIAEISAGVKALSKELEVPIVLLAQLNRDIERDKNRKPRLSDLRESGAIEQDADFVGMLYRPSEDKDDPAANYYPVNMSVAKNRNGRKGDINLVFLASYTRFESASKINHEQ